MPWGPVERVGHAGGISVRAGTCKHMQTSPDLMLGSPPCCWARLAGVLDRKNIYSGSTILIKIYPALAPAIRGRDGVDAGRCIWMRLISTFLIGKHQCWARLLAVGHV